jgi:hypothetical protein
MLTDAHQNAENDFGFGFFLERYHRDGDEFLSHRWWKPGFIYERWNQKTVEAMGARTFSEQTQKVQINVCQKVDGICCLWQEKWNSYNKGQQ